MLKIFLLSVCLAVVIANDEKSDIADETNVGASAEIEVVDNGDFPFFAQIKLKGDGNLHHCSASIIALDVLLTAAHCLDGRSAEDLIIFAGNVTPGDDTQDRLVKKFVIHEDYNNTNSPPLHDIGIIFLTKPFENTKFVSPIEPAPEYYINLGSDVFTIGGGITVIDHRWQWVQKTNMFVSVTSYCESYLQGTSTQMTDDMVCARNEGKITVCDGDFGRPLVYKDKLVGLSSFGFLKKFHKIEWSDNGTCDTESPTIFVKLSSYYDWIDKTLAANPYKEE